MTHKVKDTFYIKQTQQGSPFLINMPHSGKEYSEAFLARAAISLLELRSQEDFAVDALFQNAHTYGITLMAATFPRSFIDLNRQAYELDPEMFCEPLPPFVQSATPCVLNGIGTIARRAANGKEIYAQKLKWKEALERIENYYIPYHQTLQKLLDDIKRQFGQVILLDCHSMPSKDSTADIVLGDRFGSSCHPPLRDFLCQLWTSLGYKVAENDPYAGGFITQHYGKPSENQFAVQIEINRRLYMDEDKLAPNKNWKKLASDIDAFLKQLENFEPLARSISRAAQ